MLAPLCRAQHRAQPPAHAVIFIPNLVAACFVYVSPQSVPRERGPVETAPRVRRTTSHTKDNAYLETDVAVSCPLVAVPRDRRFLFLFCFLFCFVLF